MKRICTGVVTATSTFLLSVVVMCALVQESAFCLRIPVKNYTG